MSNGGTLGGVGGTAGVATSGAGNGGTTTIAGTSGVAGEGGVGSGSGAMGGEGGAAGGLDECAEGGAGGANTETPYLCADYDFVPTDCTCYEYDNHAYFFCSAYRSFDNASLFCGFDGMKLARIDDSQENGWIVNTAAARQPPVEYYWIGGTSEGSPNSWSWVDGTPFWEGAVDGDLVCGRYVNWRSTSPTDATVTEPVQDCLHVTLDGWDDVPCGEGRMYVCEWY